MALPFVRVGDRAEVLTIHPAGLLEHQHKAVASMLQNQTCYTHHSCLSSLCKASPTPRDSSSSSSSSPSFSFSSSSSPLPFLLSPPLLFVSPCTCIRVFAHVCAHVYATVLMCRSRDNLGSLLLPCGLLGWNSGRQGWWQMSDPHEPSGHP